MNHGGGLDKFDRIYALHKLLSAARHPVPRTRIEQDLECKRGTIVRIISYMQDFLGAPVESAVALLPPTTVGAD